ncbi:helix-turn-helix transcriptional regulator [Streptomyces sp. WMMC500]|uniref:helix-turn-helix domain-containing protein n=1 Tax=Streptomyces sp. WMMC500 TaxID=3015154 RepID=UPI00248B83E8|nr:helix-turn-helix transcriptional regulator [Streptomyces sp. WMMC500]WBB58038.1 helix-turn-helix transcriptional regulator [Streptomyces sp. WMMC500]
MSHQAQQARESFGTRLRELRRDGGLTGRALATAAGWHLSKVSRIEHGKQNISEGDLRVWCRIVGAEEQLPDLVATVRNIEAMWVEWRRMFTAGARQPQKRSLSLYQRTTTFRIYHPTVVWGTLQTADYAAAAFRQVINFLQIPDDTEDAVALRMQRQQFLYKGDRRFSVILGEQALSTNFGGADVMRGQLDRLLAVMTLPRLSLGIIPRTAEQLIWPGNPFSLFDDRLVVVETYSAELTVTQPRELTLYERAFSLLQQSAVYGAEARALITAALREWEREE